MLRSKTTIQSPADALQTFSAQKIESKLVKYIYWQIKLTIKLKGTLGHKFGKSCYDSKKHFPCCPSPLQHSPGLDNVTCNQNFSFSCSTDIYISGGPWIFMMLLYDDVYCQSNCLSVPGCQVLRGVIHNNNRAKPGSGHWTGDLKEPVRDLGKFPTHHRSPSQPIQWPPSPYQIYGPITLRRTVYKQCCVDIQEKKWLYRRCLTGVHFCVQSPSYCKTSVKHSISWLS